MKKKNLRYLAVNGLFLMIVLGLMNCDKPKINLEEDSKNSLAKNLRAITRISKTDILQDLCPKGMGVSKIENDMGKAYENDLDNGINDTKQVDLERKEDISMDFRDDLEIMFSDIEHTNSFKEIGHHNPLIAQDFGADPFAMVYGDRVYVYMTQDQIMYDREENIIDNNYSMINKLRCISSSDLVNWTDHGWIHVGGIKGASLWAKNSWAPSAVWKEINGQDKFFLYFANGGGGIGVLTADRPTGPFKDELGTALINWETPNCSDVVWMFDPAVLVDDDGRAYIYFGGGIPEGQEEMPNTARVIELGPDMMSTVGEAVVIGAPYLFEDSGINKIGDTYYYTYCSNFASRTNAKGKYVPAAGEIIYMTSKNPMGPWEYQGSILKNPGYFFGSGGNNHHSMIPFNNNWYMFYHTSLLQDSMGIKGGYRSTHMNQVTVNKDGTIEPIAANKVGVKQLEALNPYQNVKATTMSNNAGVKIVEEDKISFKDPETVSVGEIDNGDWILVSGVDFGRKGAETLTIRYSSETEGGAIKVTIDSLEGEAISYIGINNTGNFNNFAEVTVPVREVTGVHDIYFTFAGSGYHFNTWSFSKK
ncbi:MAG TPA: hypothetical protein DDY59_07410 [Lachnospiraceae bacterium]|nr:hypothetical protein [Lachnospiraceae bacterium]HCA70768.1 hypothetical protein [Lachnospiraceae bacterium]HCM14192.1 hypothetical protein [Lachnospiraceae bacterium]